MYYYPVSGRCVGSESQLWCISNVVLYSKSNGVGVVSQKSLLLKLRASAFTLFLSEKSQRCDCNSCNIEIRDTRIAYNDRECSFTLFRYPNSITVSPWREREREREILKKKNSVLCVRTWKKKCFLVMYTMDIGNHTFLLVALWGYRPCWTTYPKRSMSQSRDHNEQWVGRRVRRGEMRDGMGWRASEGDLDRSWRGTGVLESNKLWIWCILTIKYVWKRFGVM